jgi:hypothetical protein
VFPCDENKYRGFKKVYEGVKKEYKKIIRAEKRCRSLFVIKHIVKNCVGIKIKTIDDFTYVFVRNLLRGERDMLTI